MASLTPPSARAALAELVHQFADPYAFVRELVQNAIDAGSAEVEIDVRFEGGPGKAGVITVHVDDWGDGMTRDIIDTKLTRLFSSSKDGDRTKIGKFGIGFVSVFALDPDAVCIDTSRDGESWRVLFKADRTFELLTLSTPVDGTKIRVIKRGSAEFAAEVRARCEAALRHWCRHVDADIRFAGVPIREAFGLPDAPCVVEANDGITHIVVGHRRGGASFRGFYNTGLTLFESEAETHDDPLVGLAFKVSSPRLEHTLTRDAVIEDTGYHAVLRSVAALVDTALVERVFEQLEQIAAAPSAYLLRAAARHVVRGVPAGAGLRAVAVTPSGAPIRVDDLRRGPAGGVVYFAAERSAVTDALEAGGHTVLGLVPSDDHVRLVQLLAPGVTVVPVGHRWCLPTPADPAAVPVAWPRFARCLADALRIAGVEIGDIVAGDFAYPESPITDRIAITQPSAFALTPIHDLDVVTAGRFARRRVLVVNLTHPSVVSFVALAEREPQVAAYLCVKAFRLGRGLDAAMDTKLVEHLVAQRWPTPTP